MARRRRGRGEAAVYLKPATATRKATWVAAVSQGVDPKTGKRIRKFLYGATKADAQAKLLRHLVEHGGPKARRSSAMPLSDFLTGWLESVRASKSANTARSYEQLVRLHVLPHVGSVRLDAFSPTDADRLFADLASAGASKSMQAKVYTVLRAALNQAKKQDLIATSPLEKVTPPRHKRPAITALSLKQVDALLTKAKGHRLEALFVLAVMCGLRQGELFAMRWSDIDFDSRVLSVRSSLQEIDGELTVVEPKSKRSRRRIELSNRAIAALRERKRIAEPGDATREGFVFTSARGELLRKSNFLRREFYPLLDEAKLPRTVRFHDLRHSCASMMLLQGTNPKVVQELLGHASIALTLDTYSHVSPTMHRHAADALDALLAPKKARPRRGAKSEIGGTVAVQSKRGISRPVGRK